MNDFGKAHEEFLEAYRRDKEKWEKENIKISKICSACGKRFDSTNPLDAHFEKVLCPDCIDENLDGNLFDYLDFLTHTKKLWDFFNQKEKGLLLF